MIKKNRKKSNAKEENWEKYFNEIFPPQGKKFK